MTPLIPSQEEDILWLVSRCHTHGQRELYVQHLQEALALKELQLDTLGECGNNTQSGSWNTVDEQLFEEYAFYLSFENSLCQDYITEEVLQGAQVEEGGADCQGSFQTISQGQRYCLQRVLLVEGDVFCPSVGAQESAQYEKDAMGIVQEEEADDVVDGVKQQQQEHWHPDLEALGDVADTDEAGDETVDGHGLEDPLAKRINRQRETKKEFELLFLSLSLMLSLKKL
ncbi:unnamed protein product [Sphagnum tenellum]